MLLLLVQDWYHAQVEFFDGDDGGVAVIVAAAVGDVIVGEIKMEYLPRPQSFLSYRNAHGWTW